MKESKRYKITIIAGIVLTLLAGVSIYKEMDGVASTSVAGILTIVTSYIYGESKRPSRETMDNIRVRARREALKEFGKLNLQE